MWQWEKEDPMNARKRRVRHSNNTLCSEQLWVKMLSKRRYVGHSQNLAQMVLLAK